MSRWRTPPWDRCAVTNRSARDRAGRRSAKNGEGILSFEDHLVCYKAKLERGEERNEKVHVYVNNQLGPLEFRVNGPVELCVPSRKTPPPTMP